MDSVGNFVLSPVSRASSELNDQHLRSHGKIGDLACEQAHIWEHRRERQRANSKPERSFREESGDKGQRK